MLSESESDYPRIIDTDVSFILVVSCRTGWCGFGDSCKFLHDRSDYKHGWEMDNAFLSNQPKSRVEEIVEEELPFACLICREPFGDPKSPHAAVVTRCGHYFGGSCAIKRCALSPYPLHFTLRHVLRISSRVEQIFEELEMFRLWRKYSRYLQQSRQDFRENAKATRS